MIKVVKANLRLLVDYGNSYVKMALKHPIEPKLTEVHQAKAGTSAKALLKQFKLIKEGAKITKIVVVASRSEKAIAPFLKELASLFNNIEVKKVSLKDFKGLINFSNLKKNVTNSIGNDLLLQAWYLINKEKEGIIISLGTVYTALVSKNKQIKSVSLIPSLSTGIKQISNITAIPAKDLPKKFDKTVGLNTPDAFASGANLMLDGYIAKLIEQNGFKPKEVIITGGDAINFPLVTKKYPTISNFNLVALANLINKKYW